MKNDARAKLLAELEIDEASITPTQNVLITQYLDYCGDYRHTEGKERREIGKELRSIIKMLDTRKSKGKKKVANYKEKHGQR